MAAPVFTLTDSTSAVISSLNFGNIDAGSTSAPVQVLFWNNYTTTGTPVGPVRLANPMAKDIPNRTGPTLSDAINVTLTTKTYNGLNTGDTVANGQQVVTSLAFAEECVSQGDTAYTNIGGATTAPIGSAAGGVGVIKGSSGGDAAVVNVTLSAPSGVTPGAVQFLMRLNYSYQ